MSIALRHFLRLACALPCFLFPISTFGQVIFDGIPNPLPPNVESLGFQATSTSEYGLEIQFAPGTSRLASSVTVIMSSFACVSGRWEDTAPPTCVTPPGSSFSHPIKLNVYSVGAGNSLGVLLETTTQPFNIPYRPSADLVNCTGANSGKWFNAAAGMCFSGFAFPITFDLPGIALPDKVIVTVAYNTSNFGPAPLGTGTTCFAAGNCPYDSLNVSAETAGPFVGSYPDASSAYISNTIAANYCDGGAGGTGFLRLDFGCDAGLLPQIRVTATPPDVYQVRYFSNLTVGDSYIDLSNAGSSATVGGASNGDICVNAYTYSPDEQLVSCCSCLVTPNGLASLSVRGDLISNTLTPIIPNSVVVKLVASRAGATANACNAATVGAPASPGFAAGMLAWGASIHALPVTAGTPATTYGIAETPFSQANLSPAELTRMTQLCSFIQANGSGYGICKSCKVGGLGAAKK